MDLSYYIEELLYENDCVILPTIGGFIINPASAKIDFVEQQLFPPRKVVSFNPKLVNNDGLLAHYISQQQHINYKQALNHIEGYTKQIENELFDNKIVHFSNIGKLYFNSNSKLEFVPENTNFLRSAYGLPAISCRPILRNKDYLREPKPATASSSPHRRKGVITPIRLAIAAALVCLLFSIPFLRGTFSSSTEETFAEKTISTSPAPKQDIVPASILPNTNTISSNKEEILEQETATTPIEDAPITQEQSPALNNTQNYIIVLGAFGKEKNARRLANKLAKDNYLPDVNIKNRLHRVGVQLNCTPEELQTHLTFLQENYNKKAWILE